MHARTHARTHAVCIGFHLNADDSKIYFTQKFECSVITHIVGISWTSIEQFRFSPGDLYFFTWNFLFCHVYKLIVNSSVSFCFFLLFFFFCFVRYTIGWQWKEYGQPIQLVSPMLATKLNDWVGSNNPTLSFNKIQSIQNVVTQIILPKICIFNKRKNQENFNII